MTAAAAVESASGAPPMQHAQQDVFPLGAVVECQTMRRETVCGEVLCYDHATRLLVLRLNNGPKAEMRFLNLALVDHVAVVKNPPPDHTPLFPYSTAAQGQERLRIAEQKKCSSMPSVDVSTAGQHVFIAIRKTLEDILWDGENIVVLSRVAVRPPYTCDDVEPLPNLPSTIQPQAVSTATHVKKIIDKHLRQTGASTVATTQSVDRQDHSGGSSTDGDGNGNSQDESNQQNEHDHH
uniref:AD domain-containing protein n=1 Tax=Plectus sambesii TaxID=2011161 RepID=A0A914V8C6_9BILA